MSDGSLKDILPQLEDHIPYYSSREHLPDVVEDPGGYTQQKYASCQEQHGLDRRAFCQDVNAFGDEDWPASPSRRVQSERKGHHDHLSSVWPEIADDPPQ